MIIQFEGVKIELFPRFEKLKKGDLCIGRKENKLTLFTVEKLSYDGYSVLSKESDYSYSFCDCYKILSIDGEKI